jgi:hypothetical protein
MSPSQASETCASASSATSANGNSLYESLFQSVKKRRFARDARNGLRKLLTREISIACASCDSASFHSTLCGSKRSGLCDS